MNKCAGISFPTTYSTPQEFLRGLRTVRWFWLCAMLFVIPACSAYKLFLRDRPEAKNLDMVRVEVWGAVREPGIYSVKNQSPEQILGSAGGIVDNSATEKNLIMIVRRSTNEKQQGWRLAAGELGDDKWQSFAFVQDDLILVPFGRGKPRPEVPSPPNSTNLIRVSVSGAVHKDGVHWLNAGATITDALKASGGIRRLSWSEGTIMSRSIMISRGLERHSFRRFEEEERWKRFPLKNGDFIRFGIVPF